MKIKKKIIFWMNFGVIVDLTCLLAPIRFVGMVIESFGWYVLANKCFLVNGNPENGWSVARLSISLSIVTAVSFYWPRDDPILSTICGPVLNHLAFFAGCYNELNSIQIEESQKIDENGSMILGYLQFMTLAAAAGSLSFLGCFASENMISASMRSVCASISVAITAPFVFFPHFLQLVLRNGHSVILNQLWWTVVICFFQFYLGLLYFHLYSDFLYNFHLLQTATSLIFLFISIYTAVRLPVSCRRKTTNSSFNHIRVHDLSTRAPPRNNGKIMPRFDVNLVLVPVSPPNSNYYSSHIPSLNTLAQNQRSQSPPPVSPVLLWHQRY